MLTWLVTGAGGFLGSHVLEVLRKRNPGNWCLTGLDRRPGPPCSKVDTIVADLESVQNLRETFHRLRPDVVIHAAGRTPPADSKSFYRTNTLGTSNLLEGLSDLGKPVRVVLVGSAAELGPVPASALPVTEEHGCRPMTAYGLSKWFATYRGLHAPPPLEVVSGRIFNLSGPGLPVGQAFGQFAARLMAAPREGPLQFQARSLEARRDFVDVRDAARALVALAQRGRPGATYNIATGQSHSIREGLETLIKLSGREVEVLTETPDNSLPDESLAEISRIILHTGWSPAISFNQSLGDLWNEACHRLRGETLSVGKQVA